jgi:hypothetical protein
MHRHPKPPSPTNVGAFLTVGSMMEGHPIKCTVSGRVSDIIGSEDYHIKGEHVLCTRAFSTSAVANIINNSAPPSGRTKLNHIMVHN